MKTLLITQARISSSRLPKKVLLPLGNGTVLSTHLERISQATKVDSFCVATTHEPGVDEIISIAKNANWHFYQGSTQDVLDRFYQAALPFKPENIVRVTSDCPLIDSFFIDDLITKFEDTKADYASNALNSTVPNGMDCEVFKFSALTQAWQNARLESEREHVTPYIWKNTNYKGGNLFSALSVEYQPNLSSIRLTLDHSEDYELIKMIVDHCGPEAKIKEILLYLQENPEALKINSAHRRDAGYIKSLLNDKLVR